MKVLFVIPPYRTTDSPVVSRLFPMPVAAVMLGTILENAGHEVVVKDFLVPSQTHKTQPPKSFRGKHAPGYVHYGWAMGEVLLWLDENLRQFDVVGLCCQQCNLWESVEIVANHIREIGVPLVVGGAYCTTLPDEALSRFNPDLLVKGEAEEVIVEAMLRAAEGESGVILDGGHPDLRNLPLPNWKLAPPENYPKCENRVRCVLFVSRGCPWVCDFCSVHTIVGRKHRRQPRGMITQQLVHLWDMGVRYFSFLDDNLFVSERAVDEVLGAIEDSEEQRPGFRKSARFYNEEGLEVRMAAKPGLVRRIREHGFRDIALGVETLNGRARGAVKKPYTDEDLTSAVEECKRAGVVVRALYIIGFPDDTLESVMRDMIKFAGFGMDVRPNNLKLYPGTKTTQQFRDRGWINESYDWRCSSFYTPDTDHLTFKQIRRCKTMLGSIGFLSTTFGIDLFHDDVEAIEKALGEKGYSVTYSDGLLVLSAKSLWRLGRFRVLVEVLCLRRSECAGVLVSTGKTEVTARALKFPKDEVQGALIAAMRGEEYKPRKRGLLF